MTITSKEHEDMMAQFEKDSGKIQGIPNLRFNREDKSEWPKGHFYQSDSCNQLFLMYCLGYSFGRCVYMN